MAVRFPDGHKREAKLRAKLGELLEKIRSRPVLKVILFGSLATGGLRTTSDIDLIIIEESDKRFLDRLDDWYNYLEPDVALDLLVYTPEEMSDLLQWNRFVMKAVREGEVLFEAAA